MKVARYNYAHQLGSDIEPLIADLRAMLVAGRYELTAEVRQFESQLAQFLGARFVRGVNTGTDALVVALRALRIGRGDEVITQANTFHATVGAIELVGATPILVDVDPETFLLDRQQLGDAVGPRTRVLMPVHLYGKPTPMAEIVALAESRGLFVIEDAAQAIGARTEGQSVATFGHFGCFSFISSNGTNIGARRQDGIASGWRACRSDSRGAPQARPTSTISSRSGPPSGMHCSLTCASTTSTPSSDTRRRSTCSRLSQRTDGKRAGSR